MIVLSPQLDESMPRGCQSKSNRLSFSLKKLLLALTVVSIPLGFACIAIGHVRKEAFLLRELAECKPTHLTIFGRVIELRLTEKIHDRHLAMLSQFKSLHTLDLAASRFRGSYRLEITEDNHVTNESLSHLSGLKKLDWLSLRDTKVTDHGLRHLSGLKNLRFLILDGTDLSGAGLIHLANLPSLDNLHLNGSSIDDLALQHLDHLDQIRSLEIRGTLVTDAGLPHLTKLDNLKWLKLQNTKITASGIQRLIEQLPNCRIDYSKAKQVPPNDIEKQSDSIRATEQMDEREPDKTSDS